MILPLSHPEQLSGSDYIFKKVNKKLLKHKNDEKRQMNTGVKPSQQQLRDLTEHLKYARFTEAEEIATSIIKDFPNNQFAWKALWAALQKNGKIQQSLSAIQKSLELSPQDPKEHYTLGITLQRLERFKEAQASFTKAIALKPDYYEASFKLGKMLRVLKRFEEAEACYRRVVKFKPDHYLANFELGVILQELRKFEEAEACYRQAIELNPGDFKAYNNLGIILNEVGRFSEAFRAFIKVINLNQKYTDAFGNLSIVIKKISFKSAEPSLYPAMINLLKFGENVRPEDVARSMLTLLKHDPAIKELLAEKKIGNNLNKINLKIELLNTIKLLHHIMRSCPLPDIQLERLFIKIRRFLLVNIEKLTDTPALTYFLSTLSIQCFINEYVYFESDEESKLVDKLELLICKTITKSKQPEALKILCLASYRPLHKYSWCQSLQALNHLKEIKKRLIEEPLFEKAISKEIKAIGEISDNISNMVKEQYEENPYPRWVKAGLHTKAQTITEVLNDNKVQLYSQNIKKVSNPKILVAGCGTGQHPLKTASRYSNCHVTAIDLSRSSLAFAKRKTDEYKFTNIEYFQGDILNLDQVMKKFDIIESAGVLHHMSEPIAGWRVLTKLLKRGGLMKIGLYSELARQDIVSTRKEIKLLSIGTSETEMRKFRRKIIDSSKESHQRLTKSSDFFSLSTLRDLIFHVQEHRFTIPHIAHCLEKLGLKFCGFGNQEIISNFRVFHGKDANIYDLNMWHKYEESNPKTFIGMYQFWCQKL